YNDPSGVPSVFALNSTLQAELMPRLCDTGRLLLRVPPPSVNGREGPPRFVPISWDRNVGEFVLRVTASAEGYTIDGVIRQSGREYGFSDALLATSTLILWSGSADTPPRLSLLDTGGAERWMAPLFEMGSVTVPAGDHEMLAKSLAAAPLTRIDCPPELKF